MISLVSIRRGCDDSGLGLRQTVLSDEQFGFCFGLCRSRFVNCCLGLLQASIGAVELRHVRLHCSRFRFGDFDRTSLSISEPEFFRINRAGVGKA